MTDENHARQNDRILSAIRVSDAARAGEGPWLTRNIGTGQFVIGTSKVRPRIDETFKTDEKMGIYVQLYNFDQDEETRKPKGTIEYEVVRTSDNSKVFEFTDEVASIEGASANQTVVEKVLPLQKLEPGEYMLRMRVTDQLKNESISPEATFKVI